jgi:hypothetical protein
MRLHVKIDEIAKENLKNTTGKRKMGFLINDGDKLTKELREEKQKKN